MGTTSGIHAATKACLAALVTLVVALSLAVAVDTLRPATASATASGPSPTASTTAGTAPLVARAAGTIAVRPARIISGQNIDVRGTVRTGPRRVTVQTRIAGKPWRTVKAVKVPRNGNYRFTVGLTSAATRTMYVRVVAPKTTIRKKVAKAVITRAVGVHVQRTTYQAALENEVLRLVNVERAKVSCPALVAESRLRRAARLHSLDMATKGYFSHTSQNGRTFDQRITATGYPWTRVGENIARGQTTAAAVMSGWMNSSGHRANILDCRFRELGVGVVRTAGGTTYWTQDFGARS